VLPGLDNGDCGTPFAPSFFLAYKFVVHALCLNIVVASFIDGLQFSKMKRGTLGPYPRVIIEKELRTFGEHWQKFDPGSTRMMKVSIVHIFLLQLPKPLGFGKVSKLQKLSRFQRLKSIAITTELAVVAGLCDGIVAGAPVLFRIKKALQLFGRTLLQILLCCCMKRKKKKRKHAEEVEEIDYEAINDRLWLLQATSLGKTYYPAGRVDSFWRSLALGDTVTYEQVCTAVLAHMIPDYVSPERQLARAPLARAIRGVVNAVQIGDFCTRCLRADDLRLASAQERLARWRTWSLAILHTKIGMISCLTALGYGTWEDLKPKLLAPPKLEAERELEIVNELLGNCAKDLKVKDCDEKALTMTLLSLNRRAAAAQEQIDEVKRQKEAEERDEEQRKQAMMRRVQGVCDKAHALLSEGERRCDYLQQYGPMSSDTVIHDCVGRVDDILQLVDEADELFDKAVKAGAYYDLRGSADEGINDGIELRTKLEHQEARLHHENELFRRPLKVFANFVRLENADDFALIHDHDRQRRLDAYFATVILQAYTRRKQERVRFCAVVARSNRLGRFVPVSSKGILAMAPLSQDHKHIMAQRAGFVSHRITLLRTHQLQTHLGFSIMSLLPHCLQQPPPHVAARGWGSRPTLCGAPHF